MSVCWLAKEGIVRYSSKTTSFPGGHLRLLAERKPRQADKTVANRRPVRFRNGQEAAHLVAMMAAKDLAVACQRTLHGV